MKFELLLFKKKAQSGVELIITVILVLLIFSIMYVKVIQNGMNYRNVDLDNSAKDLGKKIAYYINIVNEEGDGFRINISIPDKIKGHDYKLNISSNYVFVSVLNNTHAFKIDTENITNDYLLKGSKNELYNYRGKVYVRHF